MEFLLRFDAGWRSRWNRGGFKALFEFTYHVNDFAGDTGVLPNSPTLIMPTSALALINLAITFYELVRLLRTQS